MADNGSIPYIESDLYRIRHSAAHVMAEAVVSLFPEARLAIFKRGADPTKLWQTHRLDKGLYAPHSLEVTDADEDGDYDIIAGEMTEFKYFPVLFLPIAWAAARQGLAGAVLTIGLTQVGVILATLNFLRRMSTSVQVHELSHAQIERELRDDRNVSVPAGVLVYHIDGPFFFAAVETLERVLERADADPKVLVVRMTDMPFTDMTGLQTLQEAIRHFQQRGVRVILCEANERVYRKLERAGLLDDVGRDGYAETFGSAIRRAAAIVEPQPAFAEPTQDAPLGDSPPLGASA